MVFFSSVTGYPSKRDLGMISDPNSLPPDYKCLFSANVERFNLSVFLTFSKKLVRLWRMTHRCHSQCLIAFSIQLFSSIVKCPFHQAVHGHHNLWHHKFNAFLSYKSMLYFFRNWVSEDSTGLKSCRPLGYVYCWPIGYGYYRPLDYGHRRPLDNYWYCRPLDNYWYFRPLDNYGFCRPLTT